nr:hypothetical protein [uncultured Butyrivibrio sp.]
MVIDFLDYIEEIRERGEKITMNELSSISGVNRYTISLAIKNNEGIYRNISADGYYNLYLAHPDLIELPKDFYYFSTISFLSTLEISNLDYTYVSQKTGIPKSTLTSRLNYTPKINVHSKSKNPKGAFFLYDYKDFFSAFKKIFIPTFNSEYVTERIDAVDFNAYQKQVLKLLQNPVKETDKRTYVINRVMHGITKHDIDTFEKELSISPTYHSIFNDLNDKQKNYVFTHAFKELYGVEEITYENKR